MGTLKTYYTIYEIKNLKNGKIYIGMHETDDLEDGYLGSGKRLKRAIRYYGKEFFEKRILHIFDNREDMIAKEIELVTEDFVNRDDTYNLMIGGKGGKNPESAIEKNRIANTGERNGMYGKSTNAKQKRAAGNTFKKLHKEGRVKFDNFKGKKHSEETKKKIGKKNSIKQSGVNNSQYGSRWITNKIENRKIGKDEHIPEGWFLGRKIK